MRIFTGLLAGFLAGRLVWLLARPLLRQPAFARPNYRGRPVPTAGGLVLALTVLAVEEGRVLAGAAGSGAGAVLTASRAAVVVAVSGFALMGLLDDLAGAGHPRGFRGHVSALAHGRLTSGGVKLLGGTAVAVLTAALARARPGSHHGLAGLVADSALVALAANLANLLDREPGRAIKAGGLAFVVVVAAASGPVPASVAVVAGASLALLGEDLRERVMLGDTGSNALGAVMGVAVVASCAYSTRLWVLGTLALVNLAGERVSFTRVIRSVPPLHAADRLGRRRIPPG